MAWPLVAAIVQTAMQGKAMDDANNARMRAMQPKGTQGLKQAMGQQNPVKFGGGII